MILKRSSSRNCKMTFIIGRGFAEHQILKKWKWPYLLNWVEYFDKLLRKHWYWQDLAQEIAKWHFHWSRICRAPNSEKKSDNGAISWTERNIVMKFCIHIDIDKMYPIRLSNEIWDWLSFAEVQILKKVRLLQNNIYHRSRLCRAPNSEKVKWPYLLNWMEYFDKLLRKHWYWQDLAQEIAKWHFLSVEALPSSKFWKKW